MKMLRPTMLAGLAWLCILPSGAQVFLNGNFEINTAFPCDFNLDNFTFNSKISNTVGYGGGNELDIMQSCGYGAPQSGTWFIGVASPSGVTDAFTMQLSTPLIAGNPYTISFYDKGDPSYPPALPVRIGVSTVAGATGTIVYTGPVPSLGVWNNRTFGFIAPNNGQFISISTPGPERWVHVDNFTMLNGLPLSVELIKTEASCSGKTVTVSWQTASETNNDYFSIEKSVDGINYTEVGIQRGAGHSNSPRYYSFTDYNAGDYMAYYRLKQVDFNGSVQTLSDIKPNDGCDNTESIYHVYYNQSGNILIQINTQSESTYHAVLYDATGRKMGENILNTVTGINQFSFPVTQPAAGVYMLVLNDGKTISSHKVFIAQ